MIEGVLGLSEAGEIVVSVRGGSSFILTTISDIFNAAVRRRVCSLEYISASKVSTSMESSRSQIISLSCSRKLDMSSIRWLVSSGHSEK